jgi:acyl-CoA synthetase (AMP-forming)/AMP-acid ligase II
MQRLVTFIDMPMDTAEVARYAAAHLPAYMVPEQVLVLNTFPMNSNGKVDKAALKERARHA